MVGVLLAGGTGTRLLPITEIYNKHLALVYDKPMVEYPLQTLKELGCSQVIIVTGGEHIGAFAEYLGDGSKYGLKLTYRVQTEPGGIAQALGCAEGLVEGVFPVILGDNYFNEKPVFYNKPTIYLSLAKEPERFGVYDEGKIIEKPTKTKSNLVVTGLYVYDDAVFNYIKSLAPSQRNELEITEVNNWYLGRDCIVAEYNGLWSDMGTFNSLLEVASYERNTANSRA